MNSLQILIPSLSSQRADLCPHGVLHREVAGHQPEWVSRQRWVWVLLTLRSALDQLSPGSERCCWGGVEEGGQGRPSSQSLQLPGPRCHTKTQALRILVIRPHSYGCPLSRALGGVLEVSMALEI